MSAAASLEAAPSLVELLLAEQRRLRAVDEFSAWHDAEADHGGRFETLIPATTPGVGQQYAFVVDLDACTGCKACVTACHSLNGLEPGETWRKVGEVEARSDRDDRGASAYRQTITTACHHCADPACARGCPVQAYEKDPATGIVIHLDDQCIGCRYCQLTCPYDVPRFSERLGIVRKCDMCHGRLAAGEAPACVQGCPTRAISIEVVDVAERGVEPTAEAAPAHALRPGESNAAVAAVPSLPKMLLPVVDGGMPRSALTGPTTRYRSARMPTAGLHPVDGAPPSPAEGHAPLAVMLVLTQASIGTLLFDALLGAAASPVGGEPLARSIAILAAAVLGLAGLAASVLHLGRPQFAFRAFLGLRTSWMSREIVAFGGFAAALVAALGATFAGRVAPSTFGAALAAPVGLLIGLDPLLRAGALATGLAGLGCSVGIYAVTGRPLWRADRTALRFGMTALLLGATVAAAARNAGGVGQEGASTAVAWRVATGLAWLPVAIFALKVALERSRLVHGTPGFDEAALARTRTLLAGASASVARRRLRFGGLGVAAIALAGTAPLVAAGSPAVVLIGRALIWLGVGACIAGEIAERSLFFTTEAMRGMPGGAHRPTRGAGARAPGGRWN